MSYRHLAIAAAAAAAFGAAAPAAAGSFASASLGQFGYTLFDLNPGDGIDPSVSFSLGGSPYGSYVQSSATDPSMGSESSTGWSLVAFGPAAVSSAIGLGSAQASVSGSPTAGGMLYAANGAALGSTLPSFSTQFSATAAVANFGSLGFTLSPYTLIVFSGSANLLAQTTDGVDLTNGFQTESAQASVSIGVSGPTSAGGQGYQNASDNRSLYASFTSVYDPVTGQSGYTGQTATLNDVAMSAGFTNFTADELTGQLSLNVSVNGNSPLTPIPEPGSAAMLLAGLAGLGWWARRRRA
jgi:hypothetical protein